MTIRKREPGQKLSWGVLVFIHLASATLYMVACGWWININHLQGWEILAFYVYFGDMFYLAVAAIAGGAFRHPPSWLTGLRRGLVISPLVAVLLLGVFPLIEGVRALDSALPQHNMLAYGLWAWISEFLDGLPILMGLVALLAYVFFCAHGQARWSSPWPLRCIQCGYSLIKPSGEVCPECGRNVVDSMNRVTRPWPSPSALKCYGMFQIGLTLLLAMVLPKKAGRRITTSFPCTRWTEWLLVWSSIAIVCISAFCIWLNKILIASGWADRMDFDTRRQFVSDATDLDVGFFFSFTLILALLLLVVLIGFSTSQRLSKRFKISERSIQPIAVACAATMGGWFALLGGCVSVLANYRLDFLLLLIPMIVIAGYAYTSHFVVASLIECHDSQA